MLAEYLYNMSEKARLTDRRQLTAAIASENLVFYVVDKDDHTEDPTGSSFQISKAELKAILGIDLVLSEKTIQAPSYEDIPAMLAAQGTHLVGKIQHVLDATADVTVAEGPAYYEFLGPPTGLLANYRKLSPTEVALLTNITPKEVEIDGLSVLTAGKSTLTAWEDNDKFEGWVGNVFYRGRILPGQAAGINMPADITNPDKVSLAINAPAL